MNRTARRKYAVGHPAYPDTDINRYVVLNTVYGVYAELWERGCNPGVCGRVVRELQQGSDHVTAYTHERVGVIEVKSL